MVDIKEIFEEAKKNILAEVSAITYSMWIEPLEPVCIKDSVFVLLAPSQNVKRMVAKNYKDSLLRSIKEEKGTILDVDIIGEDELHLYEETADEVHDNQLVVKSDANAENASVFLKDCTFERFKKGNSNIMAYGAALKVAQDPSGSEAYVSYNPLFLHGDVSYGKTHLMHAIGNYLNENMPSKKVLYAPTEQFVNEYIEALTEEKKNKNVQAFRDKYSSVDVLMLDDVQFFENKKGTQEIFFHIFNALYQSGKQIVLSSDRNPKEIATLASRLRSRLEGGVVIEISKPDLELRIAILKQHMQDTKVAASDEVLYYIAEQFDDNIRELKGALNKTMLYANLTNATHISLEIAKEALKSHGAKKEETLEANDIVEAACTYFGMNRADIVSKKKTKEIVEARMIAIYLILELLNLPLVTVGQIFGGRDHTTIINARDKIKKQRKERPDIERKIKDIKDILNI